MLFISQLIFERNVWNCFILTFFIHIYRFVHIIYYIFQKYYVYLIIQKSFDHIHVKLRVRHNFIQRITLYGGFLSI